MSKLKSLPDDQRFDCLPFAWRFPFGTDVEVELGFCRTDYREQGTFTTKQSHSTEHNGCNLDIYLRLVWNPKPDVLHHWRRT